MAGGLWATAKAEYLAWTGSGLPAAAKKTGLAVGLLKPAGGLLGAAAGLAVAGIASDWNPSWMSLGAAVGGVYGFATTGLSIESIDADGPLATIDVGNDGTRAGVIIRPEARNLNISGELRLLGVPVRANVPISIPQMDGWTFRFGGFRLPVTIFGTDLIEPFVAHASVTASVKNIPSSILTPLAYGFPQEFQFDPHR